MEIVDRRESGETVLRQCQLTEVYLLQVLDQICKKHGIRYFLVGGTLLGAMRHNGFIPWDDDIDVGMLKDDFNLAMKVLPKELPEAILLQKPGSPYGIDAFAKLRDRKSFMGEPDATVANPSGIFLDIFQYERMPNLPYKFLYLLIRARFGAFRRFRSALLRPRYSVVAKIFDCLVAGFWKCADWAARSFWHLLRLVAPARGWQMIGESGFTNRIPDDAIFPLGEHLFEGGNFPIPCDWEWVLKSQYKDWRVMPPVEERHWHSRFIFPTQAPESWWALKKDDACAS